MPEPCSLSTFTARILGPSQLPLGVWIARGSGHAEAVVGARRERAGHVRAVLANGGGVVVVVGEVPAPEVVDLAVAVVVDVVRLPAGAALARVDEHVGREVGVVRDDAAVHHGHAHRGAQARAQVPGLWGIDVRVRQARDAPHLLARVVEPPEVGEARVVGDGVLVDDRVRLGVEHVRVALQPARQPPSRRPGSPPPTRCGAAAACAGGWRRHPAWPPPGRSWKLLAQTARSPHRA